MSPIRKLSRCVIIAFLALSATAVLAAGPNTPPPAGESNLPVVSPPKWSLTQDSNYAYGTDSQFATSDIFWRMMVAILIVAALGIVLYYVSKKFGAKVSSFQPGRRIQIVETAYLGSRKAIHLVKVDDKKILIATTQTTITPIAELGSEPATKEQ